MSTDERRTHPRDRVIYGALASGGANESKRNCVVRNISQGGALVEFRGIARQCSDTIALTIDRKRASYRARLVWWRDNVAGVAFCADAPALAGADADLEERLRLSEKKTRQLRRHVRQLLGQD